MHTIATKKKDVALFLHHFHIYINATMLLIFCVKYLRFDLKSLVQLFFASGDKTDGWTAIKVKVKKQLRRYY